MGPEERYRAAQDRLLAAHGVVSDSRFVELPWRGLRTHVLESGTGTPLLFVVGGGSFAASWAPLLARIPDRRLIAVDRPGFGLTQMVEHKPATIREDAVGFLVGVLDALELERATFVSNSMGSLWTLWLAHDRPDRVAGMVHVGCPALLPDTGAPMPMRLLSVPGLGRALVAVMPSGLRQVENVHDMMNEKEAVEADPALADATLATMQLPSFGPALHALMHSVLTIRGPRKDVRFTAEQLRNVPQPVQLVWGDNDPFGSVESGRRAASLLPNARFEVVPGGHLPWLDSPDQVAEHVQAFLASPTGW